VLPNGRVKVIDFGISRAIPNPNQLTSELTTFDVQALGAMTPAYASPEMIDGLDPDPRDDVFALACISYELLTGRHPFGRAPASVARAGNYIPQQPANLSPAQWRALQAGLHFDRAKRAASADQLLSGLTLQSAVRSQHRWTISGTAFGLSMVLALVAYFAVDGNMIGFEWLRGIGAKDQPQPIAGQPVIASGTSDQTAGQFGAISEAGQQQKAAEEAAQRLAQQRGAEEAAQRLAQQRAAEEAAQRLAQQGAAEETAQRLAQQRSAEEAAQRLGQQRAAQEAEQRLAQQRSAEETAQQLAQQRAAQETAQQLALQRAAQETEQRQAQQQAAQQIPQVSSDQIGPTQIAEAQRLLTSMGLNTGVANGKMSLRTQEMVRAFQRATGLPSTGELTMALLETLRGTTPPAASRAKSLFTLAAEARNARRLGDATRLYEAALRLAPNDADGLLALGDLRRDANDLVAARRAYETLANGRGAAADIARERLAGLPNQQQPSNAQPARDTASQAAHGQPGEQQASRSGDPSAQINTGAERDRAPAIAAPKNIDPARPFDGTYTGLRQLTGFSSPTCRPTRSATITIRDGKLSFLKNVTTTVAPDGSFSDYGAVEGILPPITQHLTGKIQSGAMEADLTNQYCNYHMSLKKSG
jgi:tetratricopeptide (TPR) repeat protein